MKCLVLVTILSLFLQIASDYCVLRVFDSCYYCMLGLSVLFWLLLCVGISFFVPVIIV